MFDDDDDTRQVRSKVLAEQPLWVELAQRTNRAAHQSVAVPPKTRSKTNPEADARLLAAVTSNDETAGRAALADGANPDARQKAHREPALVLAVTNQADALVTLLIDAGADPNASTLKGITALHRCLDNDRLDLVHRLIDAGASPDPMTRASERMIDLALSRIKQNPCPTVLAWLLDRGDRIHDTRRPRAWMTEALTIMINTESPVLLAALARTRRAPDHATGEQVLDTVGLDLIEEAWDLALSRDALPAVQLLVEHGWVPGLRKTDHDHRNPSFQGLSWGWLALLKNASKCVQWTLQMPQMAAMMTDDAQRFPWKTVGSIQQITPAQLALLHNLGVPLDAQDESGRRLLRRLASWNGLTKGLVQWSVENSPSLMTLRDKDGTTPLDLLRASDQALARWCEDRLLRLEIDETTGGKLPRTPRNRL